MAVYFPFTYVLWYELLYKKKIINKHTFKTSTNRLQIDTPHTFFKRVHHAEPKTGFVVIIIILLKNMFIFIITKIFSTNNLVLIVYRLLYSARTMQTDFQ